MSSINVHRHKTHQKLYSTYSHTHSIGYGDVAHGWQHMARSKVRERMKKKPAVNNQRHKVNRKNELEDIVK